MKRKIEQEIINYFRNHWDSVSKEGITSKFLQKLLAKKGWKASSVRAAISRMVRKGLLLKVDNGLYIPSELLQSISTAQEREDKLLDSLFPKVRLQNVIVKVELEEELSNKIELEWKLLEKGLKLRVEGKDALDIRISCPVGVDYETVIALIYYTLWWLKKDYHIKANRIKGLHEIFIMKDAYLEISQHMITIGFYGKLITKLYQKQKGQLRAESKLLQFNDIGALAYWIGEAPNFLLHAKRLESLEKRMDELENIQIRWANAFINWKELLEREIKNHLNKLTSLLKGGKDV